MNEYAPGPDLMPARMLNEFVYCPRLFHLEWVDQRWAANEDTAAGIFTHRPVDSRGGVMPAPDAEESARTTYSVSLSDDDWGLTAVIDRVDHLDGTSTPVDRKKGHPQADGTPWPADRVQVLAQAALLEAGGYRVPHAELSYAEAGVVVQVRWDQAAADELRSIVALAKQGADALVPPPPLVDSPKCPRCSLVGLCLPDETNAMLLRSSRPPRQIVPRNPDDQPLYVTEQGAYVTTKSERLVVTARDKEVIADVRLLDVSQVCVFGHVQVTTEAITRTLAAAAPVLWMSYGGWLNGWAQGAPSKYVQLRRAQVAAMGDGAIARRMIGGKIRNQRTLLRRNAKVPLPDSIVASLRALASAADSAESVSSLLGLEGTAARLYFENFTRMLSPEVGLGADFNLNGRTRRPPLDPVNALLCFCYALLTKDLVAACLGVGLDPYLGVLHSPRYGRPALALDLLEEFRALVGDSVVLQVLNNGEVGPSDFVRRNAGCQLTQNARRKVIAAYERRLATILRHPVSGYKITYRRCLDVQARLLAAVMIGELPEYVPLVTR